MKQMFPILFRNIPKLTRVVALGLGFFAYSQMNYTYKYQCFSILNRSALKHV